MTNDSVFCAEPRRNFFNAAWDRLALDGWCDSDRGAEHARVFAEWVRALWPYDVWSFIIEHANKPLPSMPDIVYHREARCEHK